MSNTMLPFLYQTRTLQRLVSAPVRRSFSRVAPLAERSYTRQTDSIPFEHTPREDTDGETAVPISTITPSEVAVFKSIFDDIQTGNMPKAKAWSQRRQDGDDPASTAFDATQVDGDSSLMSQSIVEQARRDARLSDFRDNILQRYPSSLRTAAQVALNLYEVQPDTPSAQSQLERQRHEAMMRKQKEEYDTSREEERKRVEALMQACTSDQELWDVLEQNVFTLPVKLGIASATPLDNRKAKRQNIIVKKPKTGKVEAVGALPPADALPAPAEATEKYSMDIHGPLYPHYLLSALERLDTGFSRPSPYVFSILPRIRSVGLTSYVLGVSTAFYTRLARIHWQRFGDAAAALDMIQEMSSIGLQADQDVEDLFLQIRYDLEGCALGSQGHFVKAVVETPPYDADLMIRLDEIQEATRHSFAYGKQASIV